MNTSRKAIAALTGALIALTACGGGDDDGAEDLLSTTDTDVASPDDGTAAPEDDPAAGDGCPVLSDADAAQALGVETLTFNGTSTSCGWQTPDGEQALTVLDVTEDNATEMSLAESPAERAKARSINGCAGDPLEGGGMGPSREVAVPGGAATVCYHGQGWVYTSDRIYMVNIGDPSVDTDDAEKAVRVDTAAKVIAKLKLPES